MFKEEKMYLELYGELPETQDELLKYIEDHYKLDWNKIRKEEERIKNIVWYERNLTIFIVPKGSPRPRHNRERGVFYVKNASKTKQIVKKYIADEGIICTRVECLLEIFQPIPKSSMSNTEIYLAEKGLIRPITKPDFDNVAKTFTDPLEGTMLLNDNLINPGRVEKYYSLKPRVNIHIRWQDDFDSKYNRRKIENTIAYKELIKNLEEEL